MHQPASAQAAARHVAPWKPAHAGVLYLLFALISTALNLGTQQIVVMALAGCAGAALPLSLLAGTAAGFASKYVLDKNFVFLDTSRDGVEEARKVLFYAAFSVVTTALFWIVELGFLRAFGSVEAKYLGAVVGLSLGYALKFALDRRFTFTGARL